ncbi:excinuclease ABC subunit UvrC [Haloplasma contractile]|uniref:UvrABC system protein C n=1 Tax=Haloplasma contractile SSD-17B TaxID=1033810 RepID=U2DZ94_9MOLU|nr:excinuclease ABC subunit UvrC [Haloplasma contractile]ERJ13527.1 UvrABC system protein C [Haloplasma contractile SSD-17B]
MNNNIKEKLNLVPFEPGCYLMKNKHNKVIYVGKAKKLRNRLRSYFSGSHNGKTARLVSEITDFEYIVTSSELEALILELNLIKQHDPRYNIMLRDDKTYPYILFTKEEHPRLVITRNVDEKKGSYFGPYPNVQSARETKALLDKLFPLRKCNKLPDKVCLYYHIKQCIAPCEKKIDPSVYEEYRKEIETILKGNITEITKDLKDKMIEYADNLQFEKAKEYKDLIDHIHKTVEKQKMILKDFSDRDIFGFYYKNGFLSIQVFYLRQGKLIERNAYIRPYYDDPIDELSNFIIQFYTNKNNIKPKEIMIPSEAEIDLLEKYLNLKVVVPKRGDKRKLVDLANKNAKLSLENKLRIQMQNEEKTLGAVNELGDLLTIAPPNRIEAFDNSHISGTEAVSAMVCYIDGKPSKKDYRKYKIKHSNTADDYESMREIIYRRYSRVINDNLDRPDLIVIDGGKGQVKAAKQMLDLLLLDVPVIGLAKDEKHKTAELIDGQTLEIIELNKHSKAFQLLMNIQEEVHRFAITFHRKLRTNKMTTSILDDISGVGSKRKKLLLKTFGSLKSIRNASKQDFIDAGIPENVAQNIIEKVK